MNEFPFRVTITIPTYVEELHGRDSTTLPYGLISSIRVPRHEVETIERAIKITDFGISRSGFMRIAAYRVASEIVKHHEQYLRTKREEHDARERKPNRTIQPTN